MTRRPVTRFAFATVAVLVLLLAAESGAQSKKLRIGVIYDYSGPLAGLKDVAAYRAKAHNEETAGTELGA